MTLIALILTNHFLINQRPNTITGNSTFGNSEKSSHFFQFTSDFCSFDQIRCTVFSDRQCRCHTGCLTDTADGWHDPDAAVQCVIHRNRTAAHKQIRARFRDKSTVPDLIPFIFRHPHTISSGTAGIMDVNGIIASCYCVRIFCTIMKILLRLINFSQDPAAFTHPDR